MATAPKKAPAAAKPAKIDAAQTSEPTILVKVEEAVAKQTQDAVAQGKVALEAISKQATGVQEAMRKATEESVASTKASYERVKAAAEEATGTLEDSFQSATKGLSAFHAKAFDAMRANSEMVFDFVKAITGVKTVAEAVALQTELGRKQYEAMTAQNKELAELAQKAAMDAMAPLKAGVTKAMGAAH